MLSALQKEALTAASAHFIDSFRIKTEVVVYISKRSGLHVMADANRTSVAHRSVIRCDNSIVCVFVDPDSDIETNIVSLAHEFIHAWQVDRVTCSAWRGKEMTFTRFPTNCSHWKLKLIVILIQLPITFSKIPFQQLPIFIASSPLLMKCSRRLKTPFKPLG